MASASFLGGFSEVEHAGGAQRGLLHPNDVHRVFLLYEFVDVKQGQCPTHWLCCSGLIPGALSRPCLWRPGVLCAPAAGLLASPGPPGGLLVPGVSDLVANEVGALGEALPTLGASEGPVTAQRPRLLAQRWCAGESVRPRRPWQSRGRLKDGAAGEGRLPGMLALMLGQRGTMPEALATVVALVGPLLSVRAQVQEEAGGA